MNQLLSVFTVIILSMPTTTETASDAQTTGTLVCVQPKTPYDLIGLSIRPCGNYIMTTHEEHKDKLSIIFTYSEDPQLKESDTLTEITEKLSAGTTKTFSTIFKETVDQYIAHKTDEQELSSCDPTLCVENLVAIHIQLSRTFKPLKNSSRIETLGFSYHEGGITPCDPSIICYAPDDSNLPKWLKPFAPAQDIAHELHMLKPHLPFQLVLACNKWLPPDYSKAFKSSTWLRVTIFPASDVFSWLSTTVSGKTKYKERSDPFITLLRELYEQKK